MMMMMVIVMTMQTVMIVGMSRVMMIRSAAPRTGSDLSRQVCEQFLDLRQACLPLTNFKDDNYNESPAKK